MNESDLKCRIPLHDLLKLFSYDVDTVKCFLKHGAITNKTNFVGQTSFSEILELVEQNFSSDIPIYRLHNQLYDALMECLKLIFYSNPQLNIRSDVLYLAKVIKCYYFKMIHVFTTVPSNNSESMFALLMKMDIFFENILFPEETPPSS